jgi:hypothetical protein
MKLLRNLKVMINQLKNLKVMINLLKNLKVMINQLKKLELKNQPILISSILFRNSLKNSLLLYFSMIKKMNHWLQSKVQKKQFKNAKRSENGERMQLKVLLFLIMKSKQSLLIWLSFNFVKMLYKLFLMLN